MQSTSQTHGMLPVWQCFTKKGEKNSNKSMKDSFSCVLVTDDIKPQLTQTLSNFHLELLCLTTFALLMLNNKSNQEYLLAGGDLSRVMKSEVSSLYSTQRSPLAVVFLSKPFCTLK